MYGDWLPYLFNLFMLTIVISSTDSSEGMSNRDGFNTGVVLIDCWCCCCICCCWSCSCCCCFSLSTACFSFPRLNTVVSRVHRKKKKLLLNEKLMNECKSQYANAHTKKAKCSSLLFHA